VDIDDETALESQEWHIAARRYIVRLNGGTSGPSCVAAAPLFGTDYADVTEIPGGTTLDEDRSYDDDCEMIDDGSGLDGSPDVTLSPWWTYTSCVATSLVPFVVEIEDGRTLKLVLEAYYGSGQESCNNQGTPGGDSANLTWRWSWLD